MQEKLNLIQLPTIDTTKLSKVGDFYKYVDAIRRTYNIELEFNENARWRPGSYERLKGQVTNALFPQWERPKGANTIKKLTKYNQFQCKDLRNELIRIDDKLREFRQSNQTLNTDEAKKEGKVILDEYLNELTQKTENVIIDITSIPYFSRARRSAYSCTNFQTSWDYPSHPMINEKGYITDFESYRNDKLEKLSKEYNMTKNPKRWFINIIIPLNNIDINYYKKDKVITMIPYGGLVVCFTIPLYDAVLNYRQLKVGTEKKTIKSMSFAEKLLDTRYYSNHTFQFPHITSIRHPFVQAHNHRRYGYQWGNTCFGDFRADVAFYLSSGMMGPLKAILNKWASTYYLGATSPLNQPEYHHLGMPLDWTTDITSYIGTSVAQCREAINNGFSKEKLLGQFCENCQLKEATEKRKRCDFHTLLTRNPQKMPQPLLDALNELSIENYPLPGLENGFDENFAIDILKVYFKNMWSILTSHSLIDVHRDEILKLFLAFEKGTGNIPWDIYTESINYILTESMAPEEEMDCKMILGAMYCIFRICERIFWSESVCIHNSELWDTIGSKKYGSIHLAEEKLPIADFRHMINSYRIANNDSKYTEYLVLLEEKLNSNSETSQQPITEGESNAQF